MKKIIHLHSKFSLCNFEIMTSCEPEEIVLYLYLKLYAINKHSAFPSYSTIGTHLNWTRARISRTIQKMTGKNRLIITKKSGRNNLYDITWYDKKNEISLKTSIETELPTSIETEPVQPTNQFRNDTTTSIETELPTSSETILPTSIETELELVVKKTNRKKTNRKKTNIKKPHESWTKILLTKLEATYKFPLNEQLAKIEAAALGKLHQAGCSPDEIWAGLERMQADPWWHDKNPTFQNLVKKANQFLALANGKPAIQPEEKPRWHAKQILFDQSQYPLCWKYAARGLLVDACQAEEEKFRQSESGEETIHAVTQEDIDADIARGELPF